MEKQTATVLRQECIADGIYSMWIKTPLANEACPGQFISVYTNNAARLLPRPISICETKQDCLRIVYRIAGKGTEEFSRYHANDPVSILGPLGNGFPLSGEDAVLIAGGIGIPPMLALAKALTGKKEIVLGYRSTPFLQDELSAFGDVILATEDGCTGTRGTVMDAIAAHPLSGKVIYACGPIPMLRAVKEYAAAQNIPAWLSLEERMACGVGACLGCVCESTETDAHSLVNNKRICKDGPVFAASEVIL
ncbi:MAG: dihydroorotate dehydrogenase electron transfer subunit [Lachnospiraceae bacterium]|nr:dihydroorotate dehydrogenase electron transfer subunit [Lachnospiraceae bacterium]